MSAHHNTPHADRGALGFAVAVITVWTAITIGGSVVAAGPGTPLDSLVSSTFMVQVLLAGAFVAVVVQIKGWRGQLGRIAPRTASSLILLWLPVLFIANFAFAAAGAPLPPVSLIALVAINTLMVGASEELAFRGMLWSQVRVRLSFWSGFALVSAMFGAVHLLNGFITGAWASAGIQSFNAAITGAMFLALRIRTGSLLVVMVLHALWDFMLFFATASDGPPGVGPAAAAAIDPLAELATLGIIAVPNALYALFLVRSNKVRGDWREGLHSALASTARISPAHDHR
jgi:membrane protease YdiL (CAAX protease family)